MNTQQRHTTLQQDLASLPGQYWILFSGTRVNRFGNFVMRFLVIYLKMRGNAEGSIGLTSGAYSLQTTEGEGLNERTYGYLMVLNGIMIACMVLPLIGFIRRFFPVKTIAVGYVMVGPDLGLIAYHFSPPLMWLSVMAFALLAALLILCTRPTRKNEKIPETAAASTI